MFTICAAYDRLTFGISIHDKKLIVFKYAMAGFEVLKSEEKKRNKNWPSIRNPHFLSNPHET